MPSYKCLRCATLGIAPGQCGVCGGALVLVAPMKSIGPPSYPVVTLSMQNDLRTVSSDFPLRMIASRHPLLPNLPDDYFSEVEYVPNITATQIHRAIEPPGTRSPEHTLRADFAFPGGNTEVMFVVTRSGELIFGTRPHDVRRPHPTLVGTRDPEVLAGGTISMMDGLIHEVRNDSGHHQPGFAGLEAILKAFSRLPRSLYHGGFKGFKAFGAPAVIPEFARATERNERMHSHATLRARAQKLQGEIAQRLRNNKLTQSNPNARIDLAKVTERHDKLFADAKTLLLNLIHFANRFYREVSPKETDQAIGAALSVLLTIDKTVRGESRGIDQDAQVFEKIQFVFAYFLLIDIQ